MLLQDIEAIWGSIMAVGFGILIGLFFLIIVLEALFLMLGLKVVDGSYDGIGELMVTVILMALVGLIPCAGCFLQWYMIKSRHTPDSWGKALLAWIIAGLIPLLIVFGIIVAIGGGLSAFGF